MASKSEDEPKIPCTHPAGPFAEMWPELWDALMRGEELCDPWFLGPIKVSEENEKVDEVENE